MTLEDLLSILLAKIKLNPGATSWVITEEEYSYKGLIKQMTALLEASGFKIEFYDASYYSSGGVYIEALAPLGSYQKSHPIIRDIFNSLEEELARIKTKVLGAARQNPANTAWHIYLQSELNQCLTQSITNLLGANGFKVEFGFSPDLVGNSGRDWLAVNAPATLDSYQGSDSFIREIHTILEKELARIKMEILHAVKRNPTNISWGICFESGINTYLLQSITKLLEANGFKVRFGYSPDLMGNSGHYSLAVQVSSPLNNYQGDNLFIKEIINLIKEAPPKRSDLDYPFHVASDNTIDGRRYDYPRPVFNPINNTSRPPQSSSQIAYQSTCRDKAKEPLRQSSVPAVTQSLSRSEESKGTAQSQDAEFQKFKEAYNKDTNWMKKPFSKMHWRLFFNVGTNMSSVKEYAQKNPESRTHRVLSQLHNDASKKVQAVTEQNLQATSSKSDPISYKKILVTVDLDVGFKNALFITGKHHSLGEWNKAIRMVHTEGNIWLAELEDNVVGTEFKFLIGPYDIGMKASTSDLTWGQGPNRKASTTSYSLDSYSFPNPHCAAMNG
jgi:Starch binding domain